MSIIIYHYDIINQQGHNQDYINAINDLNTSLTTLHYHLQLKKEQQQNDHQLFTKQISIPLMKQVLIQSTEQQQQKGTIIQSKNRRALLFTMDSISDYESNSMIGGASGIIFINHLLNNLLF
jgi:hypothetical protein